MRLRTYAAAVLCAASLAAPAAANPPHPNACTAVGSGAVVPANPGGLASTAAVVAFGADVVCAKDLLATPPQEHADLYKGHLTVVLLAQNGGAVCGARSAVSEWPSVGSVLVMAVHDVCVIPVTDARRLQPLSVQIYWATLSPYVCCGSKNVPITPVGVG